MDTPVDARSGSRGHAADLRWLAALARAVLRDPHLAEDACQETWLAAQRSELGPRPPRAWLAATLRRVAQGLLRSAGRRARRERAAEPPASLPSPAELVARAEAQRRLFGCLLELAEPLRSTALLHFQDGLSVAAIAAREGCPADTVRWRLRRAVALLRARCERELGGDWRDTLAVAVPVTIPVGGTFPLAATVVTTGSAMMWKGTTVALAIAGAVLLAGPLLLRSHDDAARPRGEGVAAAGAVGPAGGVADAPAAAAPAQLPERTAVAVAAASPTCRLVGRVVDEDARPLPGAAVAAKGWGAWTRDGRSGDDGRFALLLPVDGARVVFTAAAGDFRTDCRSWFATDAAPPFHALVDGERDLGDVVLRPAGVLQGRVETPDRRPVAGALLHIGATGDSGTSAPDGRFTIAHVEPGRYELSVEAPGHASTDVPVEVAAGQTTGGLLVTMQPAAQLRGVVVDEGGAAVAGVQIETSGFVVRRFVQTADDGTFAVALPDQEPRSIEVDDPRFEQLDQRAVRFAPGTAGIRVRVRAVGPPMCFVVVDAQTREPVTHFELHLLRQRGARGDPELESRVGDDGYTRTHPGGEANWPARPGIDRVTVAAAGYRPWSGDVRPDDDSGRRQTIALQPARRVTGIVVRDGRPVAGAKVAAHRCWFRSLTVAGSGVDQHAAAAACDFGGCRPNGFALLDVVELNGRTPRWDCRALGPALVCTGTDAEGRFALDGVGERACVLVITDGSGPPLRRAPVRLDRDVDLGVLAMPATVRVEGRLQTAVPAPLQGHRLCEDGMPELRIATAADGSFAFDAAPGDYALQLEPQPALVPAAAARHVRYLLHVPEHGPVQVVLPLENVVTGALEVRAPSWPAEGMLQLLAADGDDELASAELQQGALTEPAAAHATFDGAVLTLRWLPAGEHAVTARFVDGDGTLLWEHAARVTIPAGGTARLP